MKVIILSLPAWGHINSITSVAHELTKLADSQVTVYANQEHQQIIEAAGCHFRAYSRFQVPIDNGDPLLVFKFIGEIVNNSKHLLPELTDVIESEKPDLVMYDVGFPLGQYLIDNLQKRRKLRASMPAIVVFNPMLAFHPKIYPNATEEKLLCPDITYTQIAQVMALGCWYYALQAWFCWSNGLKIEGLHYNDDNAEGLQISSILPEFQPRLSLYSKRYHFVGSTIVESVRNHAKVENPKIIALLADFEPINPLPLEDNYWLEDKYLTLNKKLIYVSFGTYVKVNADVISTVLEGLEAFAKQDDGSLKVNGAELTVLVACGKALNEVLYAKRSSPLSSSFILVESCPQLEILKRASLFITHSGQNSTSEAVHYGVPMVCIPITADQPMVAYRAADELGLGIRLLPKNVSVANVRETVNRVLGDKRYHERVLRLSLVSRRYNGSQNAARIAYDYALSMKKKSE